MMTTEQTLRETFIDVARHAIVESFEKGRPLVISWQSCDRYAAQLYGMVIALNGPIEEIVKAAGMAIDPPCSVCGFWHSEADGHTHGSLTPPPFDPSAPANLFRAIAAESLGGAKVSEEYGEIELPRRDLPGAMTYSSALTIPRLTIEGAAL